MDYRFEFQQLFPDLRWEVVMNMEDRELVNLCRSSHTMENFCNTKNTFWKDRIRYRSDIDPTDPTIQQMLINNGGNWFRTYFTLIKLNKLRQKLSPYLLYNIVIYW